jgi:arylformamidase
LKLIDLSLGVAPGMVVWPGNPAVSLEPVLSLARGDAANVSRLTLGTHTGTHVDAPRHFLPGGTDAASLSLEAMVGECEVWDLTGVDSLIEPRHLAGRSLPRRLLFKTRNSELWRRGEPFRRDFVSVGEAAARRLAEGGVALVGVDYLSVEAFGSREHATHRQLLAAGVVILEGLNLAEVAPGRYRLVCLPLPLVGADGAPARAVLWEEG